MANYSDADDEDLLKEHEEVITGGQLLTLLEEVRLVAMFFRPRICEFMVLFCETRPMTDGIQCT